MIRLENITIKEYIDLLRSGNESERLKIISEELNKSLENFGSGMDLAMFMLQKDLMVLQCKLAIAILERDNVKIDLYNSRVEKLAEEIKKKLKPIVKINPYKTFLAWLQSVEKFLGFAIDKTNDLVYFSEATKQMLSSYERQKNESA
jgi:hypothetical protein